MASYISYNKLWKMLIDKNMYKSELRELTGISTSSLAKLGRGDSVNTTILIRICDALECDISDICEFVKDGNPNEIKTNITTGGTR